MMEQWNRVTPKERQIIRFISEYFRKSGYPPTVREIGKAVGLQSSCSVHYYLKKLEKNGFIRRNPAKPRAIEIIPHPFDPNNDKSIVMTPLLSNLFLNDMKDRFTGVEGYIPLPRQFLGDGLFFILRWQDSCHSMLVLTRGDYLVCRQYEVGLNPQHNEMVVALMEEEIQVGRFCLWGNNRYLVCQDDENHCTQLWSRFSLAGKIVGIWKRLGDA